MVRWWARAQSPFDVKAPWTIPAPCRYEGPALAWPSVVVARDLTLPASLLPPTQSDLVVFHTFEVQDKRLKEV